MFLNTAIDQQIDKFESEHSRSATPEEKEELQDQALRVVRGTVQADILKEDQAQNTCIFSLDFAIKMMGDIQEYFIAKDVRIIIPYQFLDITSQKGANPIFSIGFHSIKWFYIG